MITKLQFISFLQQRFKIYHVKLIFEPFVSGVFASFYIVFLAIYEYSLLKIPTGEMKISPDNFKGVIEALPIVGFGNQTHVNLIPIYGSFRNRSLKNLTKSLSLAIVTIFIMYTLMGIFGYLTFGKNVLSDVMKGKDPSDPLVSLGIIAFKIKMIATYPQMVFCGRQSFHWFFGSGQLKIDSCLVIKLKI